MIRVTPIAVALCTAFCFTTSGWAALVDQTLGSQAFNDGNLLTPAQFSAGNDAGQFPFDGPIGIDGTSSFSATWDHNYAAITDVLETITLATFTFGIWDHDSAAPLDQVASFSIDGVDFKSALNTIFNDTNPVTGSFGFAAEYNIYTLTLPATSYLGLRDGNAQISLALQNGHTFQPETLNGAGLDFSHLVINTQVQSVVPEPASLVIWPMLATVAFVAARRRRRSVAG